MSRLLFFLRRFNEKEFFMRQKTNQNPKESNIDRLCNDLHQSIRKSVNGVTLRGICAHAVTGWLDKRGHLSALRVLRHHAIKVGGQERFLLRFAVNSAYLGAEESLFNALRAKAHERCAGGIGEAPEEISKTSAEITVHEDEAPEFAIWLPTWLDARAFDLALPPAPRSLWSKNGIENRYQFSKVAWDAYEASTRNRS